MQLISLEKVSQKNLYEISENSYNIKRNCTNNLQSVMLAYQQSNSLSSCTLHYLLLQRATGVGHITIFIFLFENIYSKYCCHSNQHYHGSFKNYRYMVGNSIYIHNCNVNDRLTVQHQLWIFISIVTHEDSLRTYFKI